MQRTSNTIQVQENQPMLIGRLVQKNYRKGDIKYRVEKFFNSVGQEITKYIPDKDSLAKAIPLSVQQFENKIVTGAGGYGANLLLRQMTGDTTYPIVIDEICFGTGTNPPSASDTALQTETVSGIGIANMTIANNVLTLDIFVPDGSMPNDTYRELGLKMDGRLFTRAMMNYTKNNQDTTFEYVITFNV